jgi:hypothetical protein
MARALQIPLPIASRRSAATVDGFSLGITRAEWAPTHTTRDSWRWAGDKRQREKRV